MLSVLAIGAGVLLAALLGYAATRKDTFHVERTRNIPAPAEQIFAHIEDLRQWPLWSPYENVDPAMRRTYSGAASGKGAVYQWAGNRKAGEGRAEITSMSAPHSIAIKMDFLKPFEGHNTVEFILTPDGEATAVTWVMYGPQPYPFKLMSLFVNMDRMIGKEFEAGLANLARVTAETNGFSRTAAR